MSERSGEKISMKLADQAVVLIGIAASLSLAAGRVEASIRSSIRSALNSLRPEGSVVVMVDGLGNLSP